MKGRTMNRPALLLADEDGIVHVGVIPFLLDSSILDNALAD